MTECLNKRRAAVISGRRISTPTVPSTWKQDYSLSGSEPYDWLMHSRLKEPPIRLRASFFAAALPPMVIRLKQKLPNSREGFLHKLKICLNQLKETHRWLRQLAKSSMLPEPKPIPILNETEQLIRIFFSTVRTAERNSKRRFECEHVR